MKENADLLVREIGPPSILVTIPDGHDAAPFGEMPGERWHRLLMAQLGLTVDACAAVVPHMVSAGSGTVVTTTSWLALAGIPGEAYYAAASGSIIAFTKSFALEVVKNGVRVNCIAIGRFGRELQPADIGESVLFLQRDGDFFVGQLLRGTGGAA
jgi:NAD(P)-dependent dehydrogenase (short-subunit alcohol dehydrogenase family)